MCSEVYVMSKIRNGIRYTGNRTIMLLFEHVTQLCCNLRTSTIFGSDSRNPSCLHNVPNLVGPTLGAFFSSLNHDCCETNWVLGRR